MAESLAKTADLQKFSSCTPSGASGEDGCAREFIQSFGLQAYRRPLIDEEVDRLMTLYKTGRTTLMLGLEDAERLLVEGMLQSPEFIYRWELGTAAPEMDGKVVRLGPYEVASRLSYFLWRSMPDKKLFDAAAGNELGTDEQLDAQARRMLDDPKGRDTVAAFFEEWLSLDQVTERPKDMAVYPEFKDDLKSAMSNETRASSAMWCSKVTARWRRCSPLPPLSSISRWPRCTESAASAGPNSAKPISTPRNAPVC